MALVGGGGAPNVAGSNPAGIGTGLNYVGDFAYAYSGFVEALTGGTTALNFTTGSEVIYATLHYTGVIAKTNPAAGQRGNALVSMNDTDISTIFVDVNDIGGVNSIELMIPPYSKVTVIMYADASAGNVHACHLTGRVY
jgi:hypothetical protein